MQLESVIVFVKVIQSGSFTKAARLMGMPVTTVSGKVMALERSMNSTLINRTTRKLNLTQDGEVLYKHGLRALEEMEAAKLELEQTQTEPSGLLRVTTPSDFAQSHLLPMIKGYLKLYPKVDLELILTNRIVNLIGEGVDLALRVGDLHDSSLLSKKFIDLRCSIWASPAYLKKHSKIKTLQDLKNHTFIKYSNLPKDVKFTSGNETQTVEIHGRFKADDMSTLKSLVLDGEGIGLLPDFNCVMDEKKGRLVKILGKWTWMNSKVSFVWPAQRFPSPKTKSFIDWLIEEQKKM